MDKETASILGIILVLLILLYGGWSVVQIPMVAPPVVLQTIPSSTPPPETTPRGPQSASVTAQIGQSIEILGITLTPLDILEESRCPSDVVCIQAGTLRMRAAILRGNTTTIQEFKLGTPVVVGGTTFLLVTAIPEPVSTVVRNSADYQFVFHVTRP